MPGSTERKVLKEAGLEKPKTGIYGSVENAYYGLLDRIDKIIPVYRIIDPIDRVVPSLALFCVLFVLIVAGIAFFCLAPQAQGGTATFRVVDEGGNAIGMLDVAITHDGRTETFTTDSNGKVAVALANPNVRISISKGGYESYDKDLTAEVGGETEIVLKSSGTRKVTILIYDEGGGLVSGKDIRISFSCLGSATAPPPRTYNYGKVEVELPAGCGTLSATIDVEGYDTVRATLGSTENTVRLSQKESTVPKGTLRVAVEDSKTGEGLPGITLLVKDTYGITTQQGQTDSSGMKDFSLEVGTYSVLATSDEYKPETSDSVTVRANQETSLTIEMERAEEGDTTIGKVLLKFVDEEGDEIEGVQAILYDPRGSVSGPMEESDETGIVGFLTLPSGVEYSFVATHEDYVTVAEEDVEFKEMTDEEPVVVEMEEADGTNSGTVDVTVQSARGGEVELAEVTLYNADYNFPFASDITGSGGVASFANLPPGKYWAMAEKEGSKGDSGSSEGEGLDAGEILKLGITLTLEKGMIKVTVLDKEGEPIEGAFVRFFDSEDGSPLAGSEGEALEESTDEDGETNAVAVPWTTEPYFIVTRTDYLKYTSLAVALEPELITKITVHLKRQADATALAIEMWEITDSADENVTRLEAGHEYKFRFTVTVPDDEFAGSGSEVQAVVIADKLGIASAADGRVVIRDAETVPDGTSVVMCSNLANGSDVFDFSNCTGGQSETDLKQVLIRLGAEEAGVYPFNVLVYTKPLQGGEQKYDVELRYAAKASSGTTTKRDPAEGAAEGTYVYRSRIGECRGDCPAFDISLESRIKGSGNDWQSISPKSSSTDCSTPGDCYKLALYQEGQEGPEYEMRATVQNTDKGYKNYEGLAIKFAAEPSNVFLLEPDKFENVAIKYGESATMTFILRAQSSASAADFSISIVGSAGNDLNKTYRFRVDAVRELLVSVYPEKLWAGIHNTLTVVVKDADSKAIIEGADVSFWYRASENAKWQDPYFQRKTNVYGAVTQTIPELPAGQAGIRVSKAGYAPEGVIKGIENPQGANLSQFRMECVKLSPSSLTMKRNGSGEFTVKTENCREAVRVKLDMPRAPNANGLELKAGSAAISSGYVGDMPANGSENITVNAPGTDAGEFAIRISAKYKSSKNEECLDVGEVTVHVKPRGANYGEYFTIDKTSFDLFHKVDWAEIENSQYSGVEDATYPKISLETSGNVAVAVRDSAANRRSRAAIYNIKLTGEGWGLLNVQDYGSGGKAPHLDAEKEIRIKPRAGSATTEARYILADTDMDYVVTGFGLGIVGVEGNPANRVLLIEERPIVVSGSSPWYELGERKYMAQIYYSDGRDDTKHPAETMEEYAAILRDLTITYLNHAEIFAGEGYALGEIGLMFDGSGQLKISAKKKLFNTENCGFGASSEASGSAAMGDEFRVGTASSAGAITAFGIGAGTSASGQPDITGIGIYEQAVHGPEGIIEGRFHVRLNGGPADCVSELGTAGKTGQAALPRILLDWEWKSFGPDGAGLGICDYGRDDYVYCDAVQFTKELSGKIRRIAEYAQTEDGIKKIQEESGLMHFHAYLIRDGYTDDFRNDFDAYVKGREWLSSGRTGYLDLLRYYMPDTSKLRFNVLGQGQQILPNSGLYRVDIEFDFAAGKEWIFVLGEQPVAEITIRLEKVEDIGSENPFYFMPFDAEVGIEADGKLHRAGYGISYVGQGQRQVALNEGTHTVDTADFGVQSLGSKSVMGAVWDVVGGSGEAAEVFRQMNSTTGWWPYRGALLAVVEGASAGGISYDYGISYSPGYATPVAMEVSKEGTSAFNYYYIEHDGQWIDVGESATYWSGSASTFLPCSDFWGYPLFYNSRDKADAPPECAKTEDAKAYGVKGLSQDIVWRNIPDGKAIPDGTVIVETVFYTPDNKYRVSPACSKNYLALLSPEVIAEGMGSSLPLDYSAEGAKPDSVKEIFQKVADGTACVVETDEGMAVYWNRNALMKKLHESGNYQALKLDRTSPGWMRNLVQCGEGATIDYSRQSG